MEMPWRKAFADRRMPYVIATVVVLLLVAYAISIYDSPSLTASGVVKTPETSTTSTTVPDSEVEPSSSSGTQVIVQTGNQTIEISEGETESQPEITTDHVVISEIQISGGEFVEIYNPTDEDIELTGWYFAYYPPFSNWDKPKLETYSTFKSGSVIKSHGFFLLGGRSYSDNYDSPLGYTNILSDLYGSFALFNSYVKGKEIDYVKSKVVDVIGWGSSDYVKEGTPASVPERGQSLERKPGSLEPGHGNYLDTDDNANDFLIRSTPEPQTTNSSLEP